MPAATILVMVLALTPMAYFVIRLGLQNVLPTRIAAARVLGADDGTILRKVVLGSQGETLVLAFILVFAGSMSYFITPQMLGGGTTYFIGNLIVKALDQSGNFRAASFAALHLAIPMIGLTGVWTLYLINSTKGRRGGNI